MRSGESEGFIGAGNMSIGLTATVGAVLLCVKTNAFQGPAGYGGFANGAGRPARVHRFQVTEDSATACSDAEFAREDMIVRFVLVSKYEYGYWVRRCHS